MVNSEWSWATLEQEQLGILREAESTLGADILLAYQPESKPHAQAPMINQMGLQVAALNESQLECLQGLEQMVNAVVIAYRQNG
jgi:hypothetical protein